MEELPGEVRVVFRHPAVELLREECVCGTKSESGCSV